MPRRRRTSSAMRDPWERQPGEPSRAFAVFQMYRDQPPMERSIRRLADTIGTTRTNVGNMSSRWHWQERVEAWDNEQDRILRAKQLKDKERFMDRLAASGAMMQMKGLTRIRSFVERIDRDGMPVDLQPGQGYLDALSVLDATRLVEVGARLEMIARGGPDIDEKKRPAEQPEGAMTVTVVNNPILAQLTQRPERVGDATNALQQLAASLGLDQPPMALPGGDDA